MFIFNSLELAIKDYLSFYSKNPDYLSQFSTSSSRYNFHELLSLMEKDGIPPLDKEISKQLNFYRNKMRNPTEHQGDIPSIQYMKKAISIIHDFLLSYLPIQDNNLLKIQVPSDEKEMLESERQEYFSSISKMFEFMDLGGISPRVGNKVVRIKLDDLFIPLKMEENCPLIESIEEGKKLENSIKKESKPSEGKKKNIDLLTAKSQKNDISTTLNQILEKPRIILLGHPGSGKTTVGKYLAYSIATKNYSTIGKQFEPLIPICIKVSDYSLELKNNQNLSLFEFIVNKSTSKFSNLFEWSLKRGLCICIIDGLDEVPIPQLQGIVIRRIEHFISEFNNNRFLISSRIVGYRKNQLSGDFTQVTLVDFDEAQIKYFLKKWHIAIEIESEKKYNESEIDDKIRILLKSINSNIGIKKLAGNPLLLTIIALANWRGTKLPNRRVDLYQIASETLIENWPLRQRQLKLDSNEIFKILEPIAYKIFVSGKNNLIHEQELMPLFEENVIEQRGISASEAKVISQELFNAIEEGTGFFLARGLDIHHKKMFGFLHLTFAEYLTARYVSEQWLAGNFDLRTYAHDDRWHEIFLLMAGHFSSYSQETVSKLVKEILNLNSDFENFLHRDLLLSAEILIDNVKVKRELEDEIVSRLISVAISTKNPSLFHYASECVSRISKNFSLGKPSDLLKIEGNDNSEIKIKKSLLLSATNKISEETCRYIIQGLFEKGTLFENSIFFFLRYRLFDNFLGKNNNYIFFTRDGQQSYTAPVSNELGSLFIESSNKILNFEQLLNKKKDENEPTICVIKSDEIAAADLNKFDILYQNSPGIFYSILFSAFRNYPVPLIDTKDFILKLLKSIPDIKDTKILIQRLDSLEICIIFPHLMFNHIDPEIERIAEEQSKYLTSQVESVDSQYSENILRFIFNNCKNHDSLFLKFFESKNSEIKAGAITFVHKKCSPQVLEKINDCFLNDPSLNLRYLCAIKKIEINDISIQDVVKIIDTVIQWISIADNKSSSLLILIELSSMISQKKEFKDVSNDLNEKIFNIIKKFSKGIEFPQYYQRLEINDELAKKLKPLIHDQDTDVQKLSIKILSKIKNKKDLFVEFIDLSKKSSSDTKITSINGLTDSDLKDEDILNSLIDLIDDSDTQVAENATSRLKRIKNLSQRQKIILKIQEKKSNCIESPDCFSIFWEFLVLPHLDKYTP